MPGAPQDDPFDPYAELQLSPDAEPELVKAAFKALAKKYHPDRCSDPAAKAQAEDRMVRINEAQRLLQSGNYRPPPLKSKKPTPPPKAETTNPPQPKPNIPRPSSNSRSQAKSIPLAPFGFAALLLLALLLGPSLFGEDHLKKALELEEQGQLQRSLEQLNEAVTLEPHNRELYRHRARIWQKLGEPERAAVDLKNAETPTLSFPSEEAEKNQVPGSSVENSPGHVPRT